MNRLIWILLVAASSLLTAVQAFAGGKVVVAYAAFQLGHDKQNMFDDPTVIAESVVRSDLASSEFGDSLKLELAAPPALTIPISKIEGQEYKLIALDELDLDALRGNLPVPHFQEKPKEKTCEAKFRFWTMQSYPYVSANRTTYTNVSALRNYRIVAWYACDDEPYTAEDMAFFYGIDLKSNRVIRLDQSILADVSFEGGGDFNTCHSLPCALPLDHDGAALNTVTAKGAIAKIATLSGATNTWTAHFARWINPSGFSPYNELTLSVASGTDFPFVPVKNTWNVALYVSEDEGARPDFQVICKPPYCHNCVNCVEQAITCDSNPVAHTLPPGGQAFILYCWNASDPCCTGLASQGFELTVESAQDFQMLLYSRAEGKVFEAIAADGRGRIHLERYANSFPDELDNLGFALVPLNEDAATREQQVTIQLERAGSD